MCYTVHIMTRIRAFTVTGTLAVLLLCTIAQFSTPIVHGQGFSPIGVACTDNPSRPVLTKWNDGTNDFFVMCRNGVWTQVLPSTLVQFTGVTILPPVTANAGRILRYTADTAIGKCDSTGGGTFETMCRAAMDKDNAYHWVRMNEANADGSLPGPISTTVATIGTTCVAGELGKRNIVTDATSPTVGSTVAGSGSAKALVWCNGANWTVTGK